MMNSIIAQTENDPYYREAIKASQTTHIPVPSDAIGVAARGVAELLNVAAVVAYTSSGYSALRMARERPQAPIIGMTPRRAIARQLALVWGVYPVLCHDVQDVLEMSDWACETAKKEGFGKSGDTIVVSAGVPFNTSGTTNLMRIAQIG
jgi:pyruvate kinase